MRYSADGSARATSSTGSNKQESSAMKVTANIKAVAIKNSNVRPAVENTWFRNFHNCQPIRAILLSDCKIVIGISRA
jgi:hypothetical protein